MHLNDLGISLLGPSGVLKYAHLVSFDYKMIDVDHDNLPISCALEGFTAYFSLIGLLSSRLLSSGILKNVGILSNGGLLSSKAY